jgi:ribonuclease HI
MILQAFTDGASRGNPGESGIGLVVRSEDGAVLISESGYIGQATNNVAEYTALLTLLDRARSLPCTKLIIHSDSELMVRQMSGSYKVKNPGLKEYFRKAREAVAAMPCAVEIVHVPREKNREADRLANLGIDERTRISVPAV